MNKYKLKIEYDGSNFVGWQKQNNGISIQESIEKAIFELTSEKIIVFGAGRTDAGVHALGQVAHFDLEKNFNINKIRDGLNHHLRPHPIAILKVENASNSFHARFSAKQRIYEYLITNRRAPLTIKKNKSWSIFKKIELEKMKYEANFFIGKHDLQAFRSIDCQSNTSIKTIDEIKISKNNENLNISISAKSFLHSQVRIMVGTLVEIGKGKITESISQIIESKDRTRAGVTAPAHGLYLAKVNY
ncbi:tRNA pseudouridine(38-40) synthase TruA [Alphaproteobacteria bacterium]|nr:tRNA pseudouridine(38-40) synthase TruA [Alphaproteobacteria bacterium]